MNQILLIAQAPLADLFYLSLHLSACPYPPLPGQLISHLFGLPPLGVPLLHVLETLLVPFDGLKKLIDLGVQGIDGFLLRIFGLTQIGVLLLDLVHIVLEVFQLALDPL